MSNVNFDDLEGDLNEGSSGLPAREKPGTVLWTNPCPKCGGTGIWNYRGPCFMCKGTGKLSFKTSPEQRARANANAKHRKVVKATEAKEAFATAHPAQWAWIVAKAPTFDFANSMREAVAKYGDLTENQLAAIDRCIAKDEARMAARVENTQTAATVDLSQINAVFNNAKEAGLSSKKRILRMPGVTLSGAPDHGQNPGAVYAKRGETYLGKIVNGKLLPSFAATQEDIAAIHAVAANPLAVAIAYGKDQHHCACCGLTLTDPVSIERGIGPICANKWFGA